MDITFYSLYWCFAHIHWENVRSSIGFFEYLLVLEPVCQIMNVKFMECAYFFATYYQ